MFDIDSLLEGVSTSIKNDILGEAESLATVNKNLGGRNSIGNVLNYKTIENEGKREIAIAAFNLMCALRFYDGEKLMKGAGTVGSTIAEGERPALFKKRLGEFKNVLDKWEKRSSLESNKRSSPVHVLSQEGFNALRDFIDDGEFLITSDFGRDSNRDGEEDNHNSREVQVYIGDLQTQLRRSGLGAEMNELSKKMPPAANDVKGPARRAWIANHTDDIRAREKITRDQRIANQTTEKKSYLEMKAKADEVDKARKAKIEGKEAEKTSAAGTGKYTSGIDAASQQHLKDLNIPTLTDSPVEGCKNVKLLAKKWKSEGKKPNGQIVLVYRASDHANTAINKPIVFIAGKYYQVPKNDLFTAAKGGIAVDPEFSGYVDRTGVKNPKFDDFRRSLASRSVVTEGVKNWFNY